MRIISTVAKVMAALAALAQTPVSAAAALEAPPLRIQVDPRVELISTIFRFAGNPEYSRGRVAKYTGDVEQALGPFRDHAVVKLARELRSRRGVSYDACMSMAVHLRSVEDLTLAVPLNPWPDGLDKRWTANDANRFLAAARQFVRDSSFLKFLEQHRSLYTTTETRLRTLMEKEGHLEWFKEYFGERPGAAFTIAPALLNGGSCYGAHCLDSTRKDNLYCMLGVWRTDSEGLPEFTKDMLATVVHEFGHSYANPVVDRHAAQLQSAADELFRHVSEKMRSQAYGNSQTMIRESLTRVCEVRYAFRYGGDAAGRRAISGHKSRGFLWMDELSALLANYEAHRDQYPNLEAFAPRIVSFFNGYARDFAAKNKSAEAKTGPQNQR